MSVTVAQLRASLTGDSRDFDRMLVGARRKWSAFQGSIAGNTDIELTGSSKELDKELSSSTRSILGWNKKASKYSDIELTGSSRELDKELNSSTRSILGWNKKANKYSEINFGGDMSALERAQTFGLRTMKGWKQAADNFGKATFSGDNKQLRKDVTAATKMVNSLDGKTATVQARAETGQFRSEMSKVKAMTASADDTVHIGVDFDQDRLNAASAGFAQLGSNIRNFKMIAAATAGIPAIIAAIGGIVPVATAATGATLQLGAALGQGLAGAAVSGAGALGIFAGALAGVLGPLTMVLSNIKAYETGLSGMESAQGAATSAAAAFAQAQDRVADAQQNVARATAAAAESIADAEQALTEAREQGVEAIKSAEANLATVRADGAAAIQEAERSLAEARRTGADGIAAAEEGLAEARQNAADTVRQSEMDLAQTRRDSAQNIRDAEAAVASARTDAADSIAASEANLNAARQTLTTSTRSLEAAQDSLNQAMREEPLNQAEAELNLAEARDRRSDALKAYNDAVREYGRNSEEATDAARNLERAELDLQRTQMETNDIRKNGSDQLRAAREGVKQAQQEQKESAEGVRQAEEDLAKTRQEAADQVAAAQKDLSDAYSQSRRDIAAAERDLAATRSDAAEQVQDALDALAEAQVANATGIAESQRELQNARQDAARSAQEAAKAVAEAREDSAEQIAEAEEALADTRRDAALQVADAQSQVADAQLAATQAAAASAEAQNAAAEATVGLTADQMALLAAWKTFSAVAMEAFTPANDAIARLGVEVLALATNYLPQAAAASLAAVGGLTTAFDGLRTDLQRPVTSSGITTFFDAVSRSSEEVFSSISDTGVALVNMFSRSLPYGERLITVLAEGASSFNEWTQSASGINAIDRTFANLTEQGARLWQGIVNLSAAFGALFDALGQGGAFTDANIGFVKWTESVREAANQTQRISGFMEAAKPTLVALGGFLTEFSKQWFILADALVRVGQQNGKIGTLATVINSLTESLGPLRRLLQSTFIGLGPVLADLLPDVAKLAETFLGTTGPLQWFLNGINNILETFNALPVPIKSAVASLVALNTIMAVLGGPTLFAVGAGLAKLGVGLLVLQRMNIRPVTAFTTALKNLGRALFFTPWGRASIVLVAAGTAIYKNWEKIKEASGPLTEAFGKLWEALQDLGGAFGRAFNFSLPEFGAAFDALPPVIRPVMGLLTRVVESLTALAENDRVMAWAARIGLAFTRLGESINAWVKDAVKWGVDFADNFIQGVKQRIPGVRAALTQFFDRVREVIDQSKLPEAASALGRDVVAGFRSGLSPNALRDRLTNMWQNAWSQLEAWLGIASPSKRAAELAVNVISGFTGSLKAGRRGFAGALMGLASFGWKAFKTIINPLAWVKIGISVVGALIGAVFSMKAVLATAFVTVALFAVAAMEEAIANGIEGIIERIRGTSLGESIGVEAHPKLPGLPGAPETPLGAQGGHRDPAFGAATYDGKGTLTYAVEDNFAYQEEVDKAIAKWEAAMPGLNIKPYEGKAPARIGADLQISDRFEDGRSSWDQRMGADKISLEPAQMEESTRQGVFTAMHEFGHAFGLRDLYESEEKHHGDLMGELKYQRVGGMTKEDIASGNLTGGEITDKPIFPTEITPKSLGELREIWGNPHTTKQNKAFGTVKATYGFKGDDPMTTKAPTMPTTGMPGLGGAAPDTQSWGEKIDAFAQSVTTKVQAIVAKARQMGSEFITGFLSGFSGGNTSIGDTMENLKLMVESPLLGISKVAGEVFGGLTSVVGSAFNIVKGVIAEAAGPIGDAFAIIGKHLGAFAAIVGPQIVIGLREMMAGFQAMLPIINPIANLVGGLLIGAFEAILPIVGVALVAAFRGLGAAIGFVGPLIGKLGEFLTPFGKVFQWVGRIIGWFVGGPILGALSKGFQVLSAVFKGVGAGISGVRKIVPILDETGRVINQGLLKSVDPVENAFRTLGNVIGGILGPLRGVGSAIFKFIGGALGGFGKFVTVLRESAAVVLKFASTAISMFGKIAGVVRGVFKGTTTWGHAFSKVWVIIKNGVDDFFQWFIKRFQLGKHLDKEVKRMQKGWTWVITKMGEAVRDFVQNLIKTLGNVWNTIRKPIEAFFKWFSQTAAGKAVIQQFENIWTAMKTIASGALKLVTAPIRLFWRGLQTIFKGSGKTISKTWQYMWKTIRHHGAVFINYFGGAIKVFWELVKAIFRGNGKEISAMWRLLWKYLQAAWTAFKNLFGALWKTFWEGVGLVLKKAKDNFITMLDDAWNRITTTAKTAWTNIKEAIMSRWGDTIDDAVTSAKNLWFEIKQVFETIKKSTRPIWEAIGKAIHEPMSAAWRTLKTVMNAILEGVAKVLDAVQLGGLAEKVRSVKFANGGTYSRGQGPRPMATGGVITQDSVGGFADGNVPRAVYGEVGKKEYYIVPERKDNRRYLAQAANDMGYGLLPIPKGRGEDHEAHHLGLTKKRRMAKGGILGAWRAMGVPMHSYGVTSSNVDPNVYEVNQEIENKFGVQGTTYGPHGRNADGRYSVDWMMPSGWGVTATGSSKGVGDRIAEHMQANWEKFSTEYLIWYKQMKESQSGSWFPYTGGGGYPAPTTPSGFHTDHFHYSATKPWGSAETLSGSGGGGAGGVFQSLWDSGASLLWDKLVQPRIDDFKKNMSSGFVLREAVGQMLVNAMDGIKSMIISESGSAGGGDIPSGGGTPTKNEQLGQKMFGQHTLGGSWASLDELWTRESNWNHLADNPTSSAYGIPQAMTSLHDLPKGYGPPGGDPGVQIGWGLDYIKGKYGTTDAALSYHNRYNSYARGGIAGTDAVDLNMPNPVRNAFVAVASALRRMAGVEGDGMTIGDQGGVGTGKALVGITNEAGPEGIMPLRKWTPGGQKAYNAGTKVYGRTHRRGPQWLADGGITGGVPTNGWNLMGGDGHLGIHGPAAGVAIDSIRRIWGGALPVGPGSDIYAEWSEGAAAASLSTSGRMRVDPRFMGMPVAPFLWAHEGGHSVLAHGSSGLMAPNVSAGDFPSAAEKSTVARIYRGPAGMGPAPDSPGGGLGGGRPGGLGGSGGSGPASGGGVPGRNIQQIDISQNGGSGSGNSFSVTQNRTGASSGSSVAEVHLSDVARETKAMRRRMDRLADDIGDRVREATIRNIASGSKHHKALAQATARLGQLRRAGGSPLNRR